MELNEKLLEKAKNAKSVEELVAIAKENGVELTADEAKNYFAQLNQKNGELDDDELDNVAGGRKCGTIYYENRPVVTMVNTCEYYTDPKTKKRKAEDGKCPNCLYYKTTPVLAYCTCPERYDN